MEALKESTDGIGSESMKAIVESPSLVPAWF
jgi:hypothetical protein